ncbi:ribosomal-protein-S5p-alanine acetyltransferase [Halalkalibacter akibai JCM 9157]|uniref:Ribosomal-protein-S5p-alanine acetyltransferase n=1 Tax=Halalkalibacter akibai (strain ATCC 43226 / DSM 21942 / CIP 109018 / JCM 9157 / 1139) TaxID=1236973 RepID=W4QWP0_HALA3|nr:ribosomal-protein-S5p-alanine acetyltransferase [Halalkalibacter akibai JCM 9157]
MIKAYTETFLTGNKVKLRKITQEDFQNYMNIEDVMESRLLMNDGIPFPPMLADHEKFISEISSEKDDFMFAVELLDQNVFIGTIAVYLVNWKNGTCYVGISLGSDYQGKGYGTDAMNVLLNFIFNYMNVNKVKLQVFGFNKKAIRSYEKCGFRLEGTLREELFRFGKYQDVCVMGILRGDWQE